MGRVICAAAAATFAALALAAPAMPSPLMKIGVVDDAQLQLPPAQRERVVAAWRAQGVDEVRVSLVWEEIAPNAASISRPAGFIARDPRSKGYNWSASDEALAALSSAGIGIALSITTPGPIWASSLPSRREPTYKPKQGEFADFVHAAVSRYGARVTKYTLINEPNQWQSLTPQWSCPTASQSSCTASSPALYRDLFRAAYEQIKLLQPEAIVAAGSLAPTASSERAATHSAIAPLLFLRRFGCVETDYSIDKSNSGCSSFKAVKLDAVAHHPSSPLSSAASENEQDESVTITTISRLTAALDKLQSRGRILNGSAIGADQSKRPLDLYVDQYGVQTNPPDLWFGSSLQDQAELYQRAAYAMWKNPRVALFGQLLWRDQSADAPSSGIGSWQSGLYFADGKAKPSAAAFSAPFWVDLPSRSAVAKLWGQVRPGEVSKVTVQSRLLSAGRYKSIATLTTDSAGYFSLSAKLKQPTSFRFTYGAGGNKSSASRSVRPH